MRVRLTALAAALALAVAANLGTGCTDNAAPAAVEGVPDAGPDARRRDAAENAPDGDPPSPTRAACIVECEQKHPSGHARDEAITACWAASCAGVCPAGEVDAGPLEGDAGTCRNPVTTDDVACDTCTRTRCCAAWDGCFDDGDCTALNACKNRCPAG